MKFALAILFLFSVESVLALSPYEVLENFYNTADQPAQLTDIDYYSTKAAPNKQTCAFVAQNARSLSTVYVVRVIYKEPAVAGNGPLFPAQPESLKESVGVFGYLDEERPTIPGLADATKVSSDDHDLIVAYNGRASNIRDSKPYVLKARMNHGLLAFSYVVDSQDPKQIYGYCFRESPPTSTPTSPEPPTPPPPAKKHKRK
jgi:hypothetical protein